MQIIDDSIFYRFPATLIEVVFKDDAFEVIKVRQHLGSKRNIFVAIIKWLMINTINSGMNVGINNRVFEADAVREVLKRAGAISNCRLSVDSPTGGIPCQTTV